MANFNLEDEGYALVKNLLAGAGSKEILLVKKLDAESTDTLYIIKTIEVTKVIPRPSEVTISMALSSHPNFTSLISAKNLTPGATRIETWSLVFEFCNGGNLEICLNKHRAKMLPLPELFIWYFLVKMVEAIDRSRSDRHTFIHGDIHMGNIFLHWPDNDPNAILPNIQLGDFGSSLMSPPGTAQARNPDIDDISTALVELLATPQIFPAGINPKTGSKIEYDPEEHWFNLPDFAAYHPDLHEWYKTLNALVIGMTTEDLVKNLLPCADKHVARLLQMASAKDQSLRWTKPVYEL